MFTGIVESLGKVVAVFPQQENITFWIECSFVSEIKIDQSIAHNGVCLTVTHIENGKYAVTAIKETLNKTNLGLLQVGDFVNLERCMVAGGRLDGHIVQGHVDQVGKIEAIENQNGSWLFTFSYDDSLGNITIEKGSITVNGTSLTVVNSKNNSFSVAIIPFTFENTVFQYFKVGDVVNLEFDVLGKYIQAYMKRIEKA